ncbi:MAG: hypothetical protein GY822_17610 [Deltaproteobacteria bacterium]|nr:hypothetical protein [Deltaproteobacteria bacterium]
MSSSSFAQKKRLPPATVVSVEYLGTTTAAGKENPAETVRPFVIRAAIQASLEESSSFHILAEQDRLLLLEDAAGLGISSENAGAECWIKVGLLGEVDLSLFPVLEGNEFRLSTVDVSRAR